MFLPVFPIKKTTYFPSPRGRGAIFSLEFFFCLHKWHAINIPHRAGISQKGGGNSKNSFIKLIHPGQRQFHPPPHFLWAQQNRGVLYLCHDMGYKCREPDSGSNTVSWIAFWLFSYYERFYVLQWWPVSPATPSPPNIYFIIITKSKQRPST